MIQSLLRKLPWVQNEPEVDTDYIHTMRSKRSWGNEQTRASRQEIKRVETEKTGDFSVDMLIAGFPEQEGGQ